MLSGRPTTGTKHRISDSSTAAKPNNPNETTSECNNEQLHERKEQLQRLRS